jgi:hypothetical protein
MVTARVFMGLDFPIECRLSFPDPFFLFLFFYVKFTGLHDFRIKTHEAGLTHLTPYPVVMFLAYLTENHTTVKREVATVTKDNAA